MNSKLIATAVAASTLGGAAAGATLLAPGLAGAQDGDADSTETDAVRPEVGDRLRDALQSLVDDGTLTEAQVDAVVDALIEARPEGTHGRFRGHPGPGRFGGPGADIAGLLGMEPSDVRDALRDGSSIAELAEQQGVEVDTIVDALVDATEERVNGAVESGRIDRERADAILAEAEQRAEDLVNGEFEGRPGFRRFDGSRSETEPAGA